MFLYNALIKWGVRNNSGKTPGWVRRRFFKLSKKGRFSCIVKDKKGKNKLLEMISPRDIKLVRYIKLKGESNPFNSDYLDYLKMRRLAYNYKPMKTSNIIAGLPLNEGLAGA